MNLFTALRAQAQAEGVTIQGESADVIEARRLAALKAATAQLKSIEAELPKSETRTGIDSSGGSRAEGGNGPERAASREGGSPAPIPVQAQNANFSENFSGNFPEKSLVAQPISEKHTNNSLVAQPITLQTRAEQLSTAEPPPVPAPEPVPPPPAPPPPNAVAVIGSLVKRAKGGHFVSLDAPDDTPRRVQKQKVPRTKSAREQTHKKRDRLRDDRLMRELSFL